jgi:hypothetical protein
MGRPRIYDEQRVATAIRLPASLRDDLHDAATARDVSVNFLVTRAVSHYLRRLPPPGVPLDAAPAAAAPPPAAPPPAAPERPRRVRRARGRAAS